MTHAIKRRRKQRAIHIGIRDERVYAQAAHGSEILCVDVTDSRAGYISVFLSARLQLLTSAVAAAAWTKRLLPSLGLYDSSGDQSSHIIRDAQVVTEHRNLASSVDEQSSSCSLDE